MGNTDDLFSNPRDYVIWTALGVESAKLCVRLNRSFSKEVIVQMFGNIGL